MKIPNIKYQISSLVVHPLFAGSLVMIVGNNLANFGQYLYHLAMGRLLGPQVYGELAAIISLLGLLGIIPFSLGLVITKFVSAATREEARSLANWVEKGSLLFGLAGGAIILALSPFLSKFLQGSFSSVLMVAPIFLFSVVAFFNRAVLQGLVRFGRLVATLISEVAVKLLLAIALVLAGYSVLGALWGFLAGTILALLLSHLFLKDYFVGRKQKLPFGPMARYTMPVLIQAVALTSFYSTDVVLVKHFFGGYESGLYAALSALGKIIFFGAAPVASVMFPLVARRQAQGLGYRRIFNYSFMLALTVALVILFAYWLFPELAIKILFGSAYLAAGELVVSFGVFMTLFTLASLLVNFYLSLGQTRVAILPLAFAGLQAIGIWIFHETLATVILVSTLTSGLLLGSLLVYFWYAKPTK